MTEPAPDFRMIQLRESEPVSLLLAAASMKDPVAEYLVPDARARMRVLPQYFRILSDFALLNGIVYGTPQMSGVAMWVDALSGMRQISEFDSRLHAACGDWTDRFRAWHELLGRTRPRTPHWHLMALAVRPGYQGHGLGRALLNHHLAGLDEHGFAAYLEATSLDNHAVFARHGFLNLIEPEALPGEGGPLMYPMWREPQRTMSAS